MRSIPGILVLAILTVPPAARAAVIDDFEEGPFSLNTSGAVVAFQAVTQGVHCIAAQRQVSLSTVAGNDVFAQLNPSIPNPDDEVQSVFTPGGGSLEFYYTPPATDITAGGIFGRLDVLVTAVDALAWHVEVRLEDIWGATAIKGQSVPGAGYQTFFLSDFPGVDVTQITGILVRFRTVVGGYGDLHVSDIRMRKASAAAMAWGPVAPGPFFGPPYPTEAIRFEGGPWQSVPPSPIVPIEILSMTLVSFQDAATPPSPVVGRIQGENSESPHGDALQMSMFYPEETGFPPSPVVHLSFDLEAFNGIFPCTQPPVLQPLHGQAFEIVFEAAHTTPRGEPAGVSRHRLLFEIRDQPLMFVAPGVQQPPDPCIDPLEVLFSLRQTREGSLEGVSVDPGTPLFTVSIQADHYGPGAVVGIPDSPMRRLALSADPVVLRNHTVLRVENAPSGPVALTVHDLSGRVVDRVRVSASGETVWRGTNRYGAALPAGVYWIRAEEHRDARPLRLVKLP
jgi:hypothetical protein